MAAYFANKNRKGLSLAGIFMAKSTIGAGLLMAPLIWGQITEMVEQVDTYNDRLEKIGYHLFQNVEDVCIDVRKRQALIHRGYTTSTRSNNYAPLTEEQRFLKRLLAKMDETDIGAKLNLSAARHDTIWCIGDQGENNGSYYNGYFDGQKKIKKNLIIINPGKHGGLDVVTKNERAFNLLLRTSYEENAHAWQDNYWHAHDGLGRIGSKDFLTWHVAIEASARVTTFAALYQHKQKGDNDVWQDNITYGKNGSIMKAFYGAMEDSGRMDTITTDTLWSAFDAFYDHEGLVKAYQYYYAEDADKTEGTGHLHARDFIHKLGSVPGVKGNYLESRGFSPEDDRYSKPRSATIKFGT